MNGADPVTHGHAIVASGAGHRALMNRKRDRVSPPERYHMSPRLGSWLLLGEHELTSLEVDFRLIKEHRHLDRKL